MSFAELLGNLYRTASSFPGGVTGAALSLSGLLLILIILFIYLFRLRLLLRWYRAKPADDPRVLDMVVTTADKAGVPLPKVFVAPSTMPNAFSMGGGKSSSNLILTSSLLTLLTNDELEFIIAHELYHIKFGLRLRTAIAAYAGIIGAMPTLALWAALLLGFGQEDDPAPRLIQRFARALTAPYASFLVNLASNPAEEYEADDLCIKLGLSPEKRASALMKITMARYEANPGHTHLFTVNPLARDTFNSLFITHPRIEERLRRSRGADA